MSRLASQDGYVLIKGHKREEGTEIAQTVAKILDSYFTGEVYHGYEPETLKVMFYGDMPTKDGKVLNTIQDSIRDLSKSRLKVSLEIP